MQLLVVIILMGVEAEINANIALRGPGSQQRTEAHGIISVPSWALVEYLSEFREETREDSRPNIAVIGSAKYRLAKVL